MKQSSEYRSLYNKAEASRSLILGETEAKIAVMEQAKKRFTAIEEAQIFLQTVAKATQEKIRYRLEDIVNLALTAVFGAKYRFEIKFEMKRGQTEASLVLYDGENELDPMEANGGGLADLLSFTLRVALLIISKNRRILILDEPMKFVSSDLKDSCYAIMTRLSHELSIQIIAVTHEDSFIDKADRVYKVQQREGVSWAQSLT
jgi:DNA repair exonuclease SbcCD ATPase subunit